MISFWEVMDRACNTGPLMDMNKFDMKTFEVTSRVVEQYGIKYKKEVPIPDGDTVDKIFLAAIDAYAELGTYCMDTRRVIKFSKEEILDTLEEIKTIPPYVKIGCGKDERILKLRKPYDKEKGICVGGVVESNPNEGTDFVQLYKSIAQEQVIDGFYYGPAPHSCEYRPWTMKSPFEVQAARNAVNWVREALRAAGRPGLHILDASPSAIGTASIITGGADQQGLRQTDAVAIATISELKVDFDLLNKVALTLQFGCLRNPYWTTVIGGFAGGPEGAAVLSVAHALNAILVYRVAGAGYVVASTIMQNPPVATTRPAFWCRNAAIQALSKHTNIISGGGGLTDAGPGTEQQLWEIAGLSVAIASGGGHVLQGCRKAKLTVPVQGTGMESRWEGEVARAMAGLNFEESNEVMNFVLSKYEDSIKQRTSPQGFSFSDLYDTGRVVPKSHYLELYHKVKAELKEFGLKAL